MIRRTFDAVEVNEILNIPEVRRNIGGDGALDATALLNDRRNICLMGNGGGAFFAWRGPKVYEGHSFFKVKGRAAIRLGREIMEQMDGNMVWGLTPEHLKHVRWFNRKIGFASHGMMDTPEGRCELFVR